jgi:hypothetical protein
VTLIRYHAGADKIGQVIFFRVKVTALSVSETHDQKDRARPFVALCLIRNHKLPESAGVQQLKREKRV